VRRAGDERVRIDKYLKVSRLAKRRSEAHEALVNGRITRDGRPLKPGYDVKVGDVLELHYSRKFTTVRVLHVPEKITPGLRAIALYEVLAERRDEPADWLG
jgi:ribosomal 50S subunit-recycling heat shock protein